MRGGAAGRAVDSADQMKPILSRREQKPIALQIGSRVVNQLACAVVSRSASPDLLTVDSLHAAQGQREAEAALCCCPS